MPGLLRSGTINVMLSHAGVTADKAILPLLPDGTLFVGGHDHLNLVHAEGNTRYLHTGSWSEALTVATVAAAGVPPVGSAWGAVSGLLPIRFPRPPAEPDVRLSPHPALHERGLVQLVVTAGRSQGVGMW